MADRLDIIIFGATGFTGKYTLLQAHKFTKISGRNLTWGIAGRSEQKLKTVLKEASKRIGVEDLTSVSIIIADCNDEVSLQKMTGKAKVIINCCGPYSLYGEVVVKSCIETGTHYVDVSIEPLFIAEMEYKYHKAAEDKGVYIVNACGLGSLVADLGLVFVEDNFNGTLNSVESYVRFYVEDGGRISGPIMHYGTWESTICLLGNLKELFALKKKLFANPLPKLQPQLSLSLPFRKESKEWAVPYIVIDRDTVLRSQRYFYEHEGKRPVQINSYGLLNSFSYVLLAAFLGVMAFVFSRFQFGRNLLLKYPELFSVNYASHAEPREEELQRHHVSYTFEGVGWNEKLLEANDGYKWKPNKGIVGRVSTTANPGYEFTSIALTLCALITVTEKNKLPVKGGVYTPAAAFSKTSLIKQLQDNGTKFEILSVKHL